MKKVLAYFMYEVFKNINPVWRKRLLLFFGAFAFLILLTTGLVFYAGYKTIHFALTQVSRETHLVQNTENLLSQGQQKMLQLKRGFNPQACWNELQNASGISYWMQKPVLNQLSQSWQICTGSVKNNGTIVPALPQNEPEQPSDWN
jgi:hypothetical protein